MQWHPTLGVPRPHAPRFQGGADSKILWQLDKLGGLTRERNLCDILLLVAINEVKLDARKKTVPNTK